MVDPDILQRKTEQVLFHCARLERRATVDANRLAEDDDLRLLVLMDLQQAIQGCIDLATHACVDDDLGAPATAADAFSLVAKHRLIDRELATRLTGAAAMRNLIVHRYTDLDLDRVVGVLRQDLGDLRRFVAALQSS